jgi:hypothetical protein
VDCHLLPETWYLIFHVKTKNMYYNQSCAAKGNSYGSRQKPKLIRSMQRAAVNIYKTENSYEMLVFAPGRIKEHFSIDVNGVTLESPTHRRMVPPPGLGCTGVQSWWFYPGIFAGRNH